MWSMLLFGDEYTLPIWVELLIWVVLITLLAYCLGDMVGTNSPACTCGYC